MGHYGVAMLSWWSKLFSKAPAVSPLAELRLAADDIPGFWRGGWTPDWRKVQVFLEKSDRERGAWAVTGSWLDRLQADLGGPYRTLAGRHFRLLCPFEEKKARRMLAFLELARERLLRMLGDAAQPPPGPHVLLVYYDKQEYLSYHANYGAAREQGQSVGVFIGSGYPHIASFAAPMANMEITLAHELTHNLVHHLPLPLWLNEGLAQLAPEQMGLSRSQMAEIAQESEQIRQCWQRNSLQQFWSGKSFSAPDDRQKRCYQLAEILTRILLTSKEAKSGFAAFVSEAQAKDSGDGAARQHLNRGLGEWVAQFLGPGEWSPKS
jgi:hypothetical protein